MTDPVRHLTEAGHLGRFYIGGAWCEPEGRDRTSVVNPATEAIIANIPLGSEADVERAVRAARRAFAGWSRTAPAERGALLTRVHALVLERSELIAQALSTEMGAAIAYARSAQVPLAAEHIRVARENLARFPFVSRRGTTAILREPIGVCGLITPWNWPLYQITAKVGPALAAGCTVVLKPSELSPLNALFFAEIMDEAGCPPGVFNLVNGTGPVVGEALATHPEVDMVSITGSTRAGVLVAQAAARTVKRVAQELGGKSPNVVLPDADLARCVPFGVACRHAQSRPVLQRAYAHAGPARATGRGRGPGQGSSKGIRGGRSRAGGDHSRNDRQSRPVRPNPGDDRDRHRGRRKARDWRPRPA